jgi:uncharacterized membrane protein YbhN (UPF0104 family)
VKHIGILLKLAATAALLWFVFSRVDVAELAGRVSRAQIAVALAAGAALLSLQALLVAVRLRLCVRMLGHDIPTSSAWVASQYGGFFSHTPISFLGGDAMRVWHMMRKGLPLADSAKAVFMDRVLGFMGMVTLVLASAPALRAAIKDPAMWTGFVLMLAAGVAACVGFLLLGRLRPNANSPKLLRRLADFASLSRYLVAHPALAAEAFAMGLGVTALNVVAIWAIGLGYAAQIDLATAFSGVPIVFLIAMIPVSIAGWGLRESALVVAFGLFGVPAASSLTVSITYGIAVLLAYSPAPVLWFLARRRSAMKATPGEYAPASEAPPGRS